MARLEFQIDGNNTGLANAATQSVGILESLQSVADKLKIEIFKASSIEGINSAGTALTIVNGKINEYINTAAKGSQAFKDIQATAALDSLSAKLSAITGNATLFGASIKNQQVELSAYQATIAKLLSGGISPFDTRVQTLKGKVDALTDSIQKQNAAIANTNAANAAAAAQAKMIAGYQQTGSLILDQERKVKNLQTALTKAFDERSIIQYRNRLIEAEKELERLRSLGLTAAASTSTLGMAARNTAGGFGQVGVELGRVVQDAPYAANNFGAIGNNLTRLVEVSRGYADSIKANLIAQGQAVTSGNVFKGVLSNLFTGFSGLSIAISAVVAGYVFYQQYQQRQAKLAEAAANAIEKEKHALDNYLVTLDASTQVSAKAAGSYAQEVSKLDFLFSAIQRNTHARYENGTAVQELQRLYPEVFGNLSENERLTNKVTTAYQNLRAAIVETATVQAANKLAGDALEQNIKNTYALRGATQQATAAYQKYVDLIAKRDELRKKEAQGEDPGVQIVALNSLINTQFSKVQDLIKVQLGYQGATKRSAQEVKAYFEAAGEAQAKLNLLQPKRSGILLDLENQLKRLQDIRPTIKIQTELDLNTKQIKEVQDKIDKLGGAKGTKKAPKVAADTSAQNQLSLTEQLRGIQEKSANSSSLSGLSEGYEEQRQKILNSYKGLFADLDALEQKNVLNTKISEKQKSDNIAAINAARITLAANKAKELSAVEITEATRVSNEVQRIRDDAGIKTVQTKAKELATIEATYNAEVVKAQGNELILDALREGRLAKIQAVNDKYQAITEDLYAKIGLIQAKADGAQGTREESVTAKIKAEWDQRRLEAKKYFDELNKLYTNKDPNDAVSAFNSLIIKAQSDVVDKSIDKGQSNETTKAVTDEFNKGLQRGVRSFANSFYNTLTNINQQADSTFQGIFSSIVSGLTSSLNSVFLELASKSLSDALKKGIDSGTSILSGKLGAAVIAAGIAGGLVSGITPKTSAVGQAGGGLLSGAASGAALGSLGGPGGALIGAIGGGIVGAVGGLFGSKKAQEEEKKIQEQQLVEAQKQTQLLRQQALAYTSSVIGRQTTAGIITSVDVNEWGELTAEVSGKALKFVLGRADNSR